MTKPITQLFQACTLALGLFSCCSNMIVSEYEPGTASEVEGRVITENGNPAAHAKVYLRPTHYLAPPWKVRHLPDSGTISDETTDSDGRFLFRNVESGRYLIEIAGDQSAMSVQFTVPESSKSVGLEDTYIGPTGSIKGRINLPVSDDSSRAWVFAFGTRHSVMTDVRQQFTLNNMPAGTYRLRIGLELNLPLVLSFEDSVSVYPDSVTDIGVLNVPSIAFFKGCTSGDCDSIALEEILHANELPDSFFASAARWHNGRLVHLDLSGHRLYSLTSHLGSLSRLRTLKADRCGLGELPGEIGFLSSLCTLSVSHNQLSTVPAELAFIDSLRYISFKSNILLSVPRGIANDSLKFLDLSENAITSIPKDLIECTGLVNFSVRHNRICYPTERYGDENQEWKKTEDFLNAADPGWETTQRCD